MSLVERKETNELSFQLGIETDCSKKRRQMRNTALNVEHTSKADVIPTGSNEIPHLTPILSLF